MTDTEIKVKALEFAKCLHIDSIDDMLNNAQKIEDFIRATEEHKNVEPDLIELGRMMYDIALEAVRQSCYHGFIKDEIDRNKVCEAVKELFEKDYIIIKRRKES